MARRSARAKPRRITVGQKAKSRATAAKSPPKRKPGVGPGRAGRARVRVVRSRPTRAKRPARPLPPPDPISERVFTTSLDRSLRDYRMLWEALAKR